jgi:hypothetical protein
LIDCDNYGIGFIAGSTSGNVELLDFDLKNSSNQQLYNDFCLAIEEVLPGITEKVVIESTINSGYHWYYRCKEQLFNSHKIASENKKVIIETKAERGYSVCYPTDGYIRISAKGLEEIPVLERSEYLKIHLIAKLFDESEEV